MQQVPPRPLHFSTRGSHDPLRDLRALNERGAILPLAPLAGRTVGVEIVQWPYRYLGILAATLGGIRHGTGARVAAEEDRFYFGITLQGRSVMAQRRQEMTLADGAGVLLSAGEGFSVTHPDLVRFLGLRLSRALLDARLRDVDAAVMRLIRRDTPALELLTRYVGIAASEARHVSAELEHAITQHLYDLVSLALDGEQETFDARVGVRAARLRIIKSDIAANITDHGLGAATLALRHHVTARYVHKLFEGEGTTCSAFILQLRLEYVHRKLTDPRSAGQAISTLAFEAGFNDLSHFNRAFRRRYGDAPSAFRSRI